MLGAVELLPGLIRAAVVSSEGAVSQLVERPLDPQASTRQLEHVIADVARCFAFQRVRGIGIACPGLVDTGSGAIVELLDLPQLNGFPLTDVIARHGRAPTVIEHRARLQAMGDRWFGQGRGRRSFASVTTGETLGVGILYDGQVIAPPGGRSGAHMIVAAAGDACTCGGVGCWKAVATTPWLRRQARAANLSPDAGLADLVAAAATGDQRAESLLDRYADNLALGLINIQHLFAPGLFILHGEVRSARPDFHARIEQRLLAVTSWNAEAERPQVVVADVDEGVSALLGGAGLVLTRLG